MGMEMGGGQNKDGYTIRGVGAFEGEKGRKGVGSDYVLFLQGESEKGPPEMCDDARPLSHHPVWGS